MWVGGPIPLGYATVNKKLVIVPEEAETVRTMFRLYLECGSIAPSPRSLLAETPCRRSAPSRPAAPKAAVPTASELGIEADRLMPPEIGLEFGVARSPVT
jgi:hypothetical protein